MKRMLLNATHQEELRVAIVEGQDLIDLDIDSTISNLRKGNIYKGVVTRIEPSLEAAFVDYGSTRQGFLPLKELSKIYFKNYDSNTPMSSVKIQEVLEVGQELIVQIDKDERGNKGAALSTFISLAGRFLVLMPNNTKGGGISRRISGEDRQELKQRLEELEIPKEHALIFRTAGIGRSSEEFQWDLDYLLKIWEAITSASSKRPGPFLIYQENNVIVRSLRDNMSGKVDEIIVDDHEVYERAKRFMEMVMPNNLGKLKHYNDTVPLFSRYQVEMQIEAAFSRHVKMKSGAELVIDHTEALTTVDVNSAKSTSGSDIEETALKTNLDAVNEIARQLRIRDIGGLVIVDFIDMLDPKNQRMVEKQMTSALKADRARVQVGKISRFGLLEMSRQRLRSALGEANYIKCPHCEGTGMIRSIPSSALSILRVIEEEALKENTEVVHAYLPLEIATYLLNEKRHEVSLIERRLATKIILLPSADMRVPNFHIKRMRAEDIGREKADRPSYKLKNSDTQATPTNSYTEYREQIKKVNKNTDQALIGLDDITPKTPPPSNSNGQKDKGKAKAAKPQKQSKGLLGSVLSIFGLGDSDSEKKTRTNTSKKTYTKNYNPRKNNNYRKKNTRNYSNNKPHHAKDDSTKDGTKDNKPKHKPNHKHNNHKANLNNPNYKGNKNTGGDGQDKPDQGNRKHSNQRKPHGNFRPRKPRHHNQGNNNQANGNKPPEPKTD